MDVVVASEHIVIALLIQVYFHADEFIARGRIVKDRATGKTKMTCRNWECGVLVPVDEETNCDPDISLSMAEGSHMLDIFRKTLPVPIIVPGAKYTTGSSGREGKKPWFFMED